MTTFIIIGLILVAALCVVIRLVVSVIDEANGLGGNSDDAQARRTEERKNERIRKEIEQWREGK